MEGIPSDELLSIVEERVTKDDIRVLTDTITVVGCNIISVDISAKIDALSDTIENIKKQFIQKFESTKRLGWNVTRSWIIAHLFTEGVENIVLIEPKEDIVIKGNESAILGSFKIEKAYSP